jgi:nucleotide-binding universal stress UspA family protein
MSRRRFAVADQRDADLIVVGSRERGFLERLLGRSVDEAVARRAERDVLLVQ